MDFEINDYSDDIKKSGRKFPDCVHGSFVTSRKGNKIVGYILGVLVFTSFDDWRFSHLKHHANFENLDARGYGDIWTLTLSEYDSFSSLKRVRYRL
jgi:omega-6 fatty acid desaturase (delta-12 desaturase)